MIYATPYLLYPLILMSDECKKYGKLLNLAFMTVLNKRPPTKVVNTKEV